MAGEGDGRQRVLVRADLLVTATKLLRTWFQMEYLPSGALCNGRVTAVSTPPVSRPSAGSRAANAG